MFDNLPEIVQTKHIAEHLHVTRATVNRWRVEGTMPPPIIRGKHPRWHRDTIATWLRGK